jgi:hypothetical protein
MVPVVAMVHRPAGVPDSHCLRRLPCRGDHDRLQSEMVDTTRLALQRYRASAILSLFVPSS